MALAVVLAWGGAAAHAAARPSDPLGPSTMAAAFTTTAPGTPTGLAIEITYRKTDAPRRRPAAITHIDITLPAGSGFEGRAVPVCTASDVELMTLGRLACPPSTQIGHGTLSTVTGLGEPVDPATTDTVWYNGGDHLIEVVLFPGTPAALARERLHVRDGHLVADVRLFPGGPPNGVAVSNVTFEIYERGAYFSTPPQCSRSQRWRFRAVFGFDDGTRQQVRASSPCESAVG